MPQFLNFSTKETSGSVICCVVQRVNMRPLARKRGVVDHRQSVCNERLEPSCFICGVLKYNRGIYPKYRLVYRQIQLLHDRFMQVDRDHCGSQFHPWDCDGLQRCYTRFWHNKFTMNSFLVVYEAKILLRIPLLRPLKVMQLNIVEHNEFLGLKAARPGYTFKIWKII